MGLNNCRVCSDGPLWEDHGTEQLRENHGLVQFDQLPETSWAGFWAPGASELKGFCNPFSSVQSVQLFNLIMFPKAFWAGFWAPGASELKGVCNPFSSVQLVQLFNLIMFPEASWAGFWAPGASELKGFCNPLSSVSSVVQFDNVS